MIVIPTSVSIVDPVVFEDIILPTPLLPADPAGSPFSVSGSGFSGEA